MYWFRKHCLLPLILPLWLRNYVYLFPFSDGQLLNWVCRLMSKASPVMLTHHTELFSSKYWISAFLCHFKMCAFKGKFSTNLPPIGSIRNILYGISVLGSVICSIYKLVRTVPQCQWDMMNMLLFLTYSVIVTS